MITIKYPDDDGHRSGVTGCYSFDILNDEILEPGFQEKGTVDWLAV